MRDLDLDKDKVYFLGNLIRGSVGFCKLNTWLKRSNKEWNNRLFNEMFKYNYLYFNWLEDQWELTNVPVHTVCGLTMLDFEAPDLNVDRYPDLFFNQIEELKKTANKLGLTIDILIKNK